MSKPPKRDHQGAKNLGALRGLRDQLKQQTEQQEHLAEQRRQEEARIFREALKEVKPLKQTNRIIPQPQKPQPIPHQHLRDEANALQESISDEMDIDRLLETDETLSYRREGLNPDVLRKLRRGHWTIQDEIDLHGLRRDEARTLLGTFLRDCVQQRRRCVRVIHGKGHGSINKEPVLKHKVRVWLVQKEEVLAFCQARAPDGGSGALIVLLRDSHRN